MGVGTRYWARLHKKPLRFAVLVAAGVGLLLEFTSRAGSARDHVGLVIVLVALLCAALGLQSVRSGRPVSTWGLLATKLRRSKK
jgi:hypothetical protein